MTKEEFIEREMSEYRAQWDAGYFPAVLDAFRQCVVAEVPIPQWLADAMLPELVFAFREGGKEGRSRRDGGHLARAKRRDIHTLRYEEAEIWLRARAELPGFGYAATREGAFAFVSEQLRGTSAQGSAKAIEESYDMIARERTAPPISDK